MILFVIVGCSDDDPEPAAKYMLSLRVNPEEKGEVTGAGEYQEGEQVAIDATPVEGFVFLRWTGDVAHLDDTFSANTTITMPAQNTSLTAVFEEGSLVDIDLNVYQAVNIGNQEWMAENLRVTRYNNGDAIPTGLSDDEWANTTAGAFAVYDHNGWNTDGINSPWEMVEAYGNLYNWYVVNDSRGVCPEGWRVPSDDDWTQMVDYVVAQGYPNEWEDPNGAGNALKSCRQEDHPDGGNCDTSEHPRWGSHDIHSGFDEFGFSGLPGGCRRYDGSYSWIGKYGYWWTSTEQSSLSAWRQLMFYEYSPVFRFQYHKTYGLSLRCVRDLD